MGDRASTDDGFFGSGIYFTGSAEYCSETYGKEHMVLAWGRDASAIRSRSRSSCGFKPRLGALLN